MAIFGAVTAWIAATAPFAFASPTISCNANSLAQPYASFVYQPHDPADPETVCKSMLTSRCSTMQDRQGHDISACKLIYEEMKAAALEYQTHVNAGYCNSLTTLYSTCPVTALHACHQREDQQHAQAENGVLGLLNQRKAAIRDWKRQITAMRQKFAPDLRSNATHLNCAVDQGGAPLQAADYADLAHRTPTDPSSLAAQLTALDGRVTQFESVIQASVARHTSQRSSFQTMATASSKSARNLGSVAGPNAAGKGQGDPKSDITGADKEQSAQQAPQQGGGGGGSPGGGGAPSGGGSPSENALASGTGPGESGGAQPQVAHRSSGASDGARNSTGGSTAAKAVKPSDAPKVESSAAPSYSTSGPSLSASSGATNPTQNSTFGASSAQPNRAGASGGGGGGGASAGGSGSLGSPCSGKDCQAAGAGLFGGVGALGSGSPVGGGGGESGGLASLGSLDASASLDNLFKDDKAKAAAAGAGALDGMTNLDSATAGLEAGAGGDVAAAQAGGDIGSVDGDLFSRLHQFHERAQKRGMVVGLTRKL